MPAKTSTDNKTQGQNRSGPGGSDVVLSEGVKDVWHDRATVVNSINVAFNVLNMQ